MLFRSKKIIDEPEILTAKIKYVYVSFALTGGVAFLFAVMPGAFFSSFVSSAEQQALSQIPSEHLQPLLSNLTEMRKAVVSADSWRSFFIILAGTFCLLLFKARKLKALPVIAVLTVLCLIDMWQVNKRYLNDGMFVEKSVREQPVEMSQAEHDF